MINWIILRCYITRLYRNEPPSKHACMHLHWHSVSRIFTVLVLFGTWDERHVWMVAANQMRHDIRSKQKKKVFKWTVIRVHMDVVWKMSVCLCPFQRAIAFVLQSIPKKRWISRIVFELFFRFVLFFSTRARADNGHNKRSRLIGQCENYVIFRYKSSRDIDTDLRPYITLVWIKHNIGMKAEEGKKDRLQTKDMLRKLFGSHVALYPTLFGVKYTRCIYSQLKILMHTIAPHFRIICAHCMVPNNQMLNTVRGDIEETFRLCLIVGKR